MIDRRQLLKNMAAVGAGVMAVPTSLRQLFAAAVPERTSARRLSRVAVQLYTVRRALNQDIAGTLAHVAQIGYKEVEFAGYANKTPEEIRDLLKQNGLTAPSTHVGLPAILKDPSKMFADSRVMGHEWVTVPSPPGRMQTIDDWKRLAGQFNDVGRQAHAAGIRFAYHNHNEEARPMGATTPLDALITETDPSLVDFEMDCYWVVNGGGNPLDYLARYPGRIKMIHAKDAAGPEHKMVDVGAGSIDFKAILERGKDIQHVFVEHDEPVDPWASIAASYKYLSTLDY